MKRTIKTYFKFFMLFFGITLLLVNCENDQISKGLIEIENKEIQTPNFTIEIIKTEQIQENETISRKLKEIKGTLTKGKENTQNKDVYSSEYDFTINTDFAKYIESTDGLYHSYTFPIVRDEDNGLHENLLLSLQPDETYKVFIISYNLTEGEWIQFVNGSDIGLTADDITSTEIVGEGIVTDVFSKVETTNCYWVLIEFCANNNHPGGYINGEKCPAYSTDTESYCLGYGGGGGENPTSPDGSDDETDNDDCDTCSANGGTNTTVATSAEIAIGNELNLILGSNDSYVFNNTINLNESLEFSSVSEFENYLNNDVSFEQSSDVLSNQNGTHTTEFRVVYNYITNLNILINQNLKDNSTNQDYELLSLNSNLSGVTLGISWTQNLFDYIIFNNTAIIDLYGSINYNLFIEGVGTIYTDAKHYQMIINIVTGEQLAITEIE